MRVTRDFSAGGGGVPLRSLREAGQGQGNRSQGYRDRETGPGATGNQYKNPMTTPLRARGTVADNSCLGLSYPGILHPEGCIFPG